MEQAKPNILDYGRQESYAKLRRLLVRIAIAILVGYGLINLWNHVIWPTIQYPWACLVTARERDRLYDFCAASKASEGAYAFDESGDVPNDFGPRKPRPPDGSLRLSSHQGLSQFGPTYWQNPHYSVYEWEREGWLMSARMGIPRCLAAVRSTKSFSGPIATDLVYMHEHVSRSANKRMVIIGFDPIRFCLGYSDVFVGELWERGGVLTLRKLRGRFDPLLSLNITADQKLRIYAGHHDANDKSHFTIDYDTQANKGVIDGWLQDDDTIKMQIRSGPAY